METKEIKNCILYYPTINIPNRVWLRNSLLYWDEIASIVPDNLQDTVFSTELCILKEAKYFRPLSPRNFLDAIDNYKVIQLFASEFFEIVKSNKFKQILHIKYRPKFIVSDNSGFYRVESDLLNYGSIVHDDKVRQNRRYNTPSELQYSVRVNNDKLTHSVIDRLIEMNLLFQSSEDGWWKMESNTALVYLSLLAKYMADVDHQNTIPGTSNPAYEELMFLKAADGTERLPVCDLFLKNILPVPKSTVTIEKIIDFKKNANRVKELHKFQGVLKTMQTNLSSARNEKELKEMIYTFKRDIRFGVEGLSDVLKESKIETLLGGVKNIIGIRPLAEGSIASLGLNKLKEEFDLNINPVSTGMAAAAVIELGYYYIQRRNNINNIIRNSPYSYLYHLRSVGLAK